MPNRKTTTTTTTETIQVSEIERSVDVEELGRRGPRTDPYYDSLLKDRNVARWFRYLKKNSPIVADIYLRRLGSFCRHYKTTPARFGKLPIKTMEDMALDFVDYMEQATTISPLTGRAYAPSYIGSNIKAVKSWAEFCSKRFQRKIRISNLSKTPTLESERVPTVDELRRVLYAPTTPLRTRVMIALMAFSGPREEVQGDFLGVEGLKVRDFPEMEIVNGEIRFLKIPTILIVREELSKNGRQYLTLLGPEGCAFLKDYLESRLKQRGESLAPISGIIATSEEQAALESRFGVQEDASPMLRTNRIGAAIRKAMRAVELPWRPYVFRSYFDTQLLICENKGLVSHPFRMFWMGHKGDIEAVYTTNKRQLPAQLLEEMRSSYQKCIPYLETRSDTLLSRDEWETQQKRDFLEWSDWKEEEITALGPLSKYTIPELRELNQQKKHETNTNGLKIIRAEELERYLLENWEYEKNEYLEARGKILVRLPKK